MRIGEYVSESFKYANEGLIGKWSRWLTLIVFSIFFPLMMGYSIRIMEGKETAPSVDDNMFIDGIKMIIINIAYMIVPIIIGVIIFFLSGGFGSLTMLGMDVTNPWAYFGLLVATFGVALIVFIIVAFIFSLFGIIGMVRFARTGSMGEAFAFGEINNIIGKIGWIQYIIALIIIMIILCVIYVILGLIPIIGILLELILTPYFSMVTARYYAQLYDAGA